MSSIKPKRRTIKIVDGPVTVADGSLVSPLEVKTPRDALRATMMMLFQHVAEVHYAITEIISEKYNIPEEEIYGAITEHPKWQEMLVNPMIHDLTGEIVEKTIRGDASDTASVVSEASTAASSGSAKKRGRPKGSKWTEEQKAAAAAKRAAKKAAAAVPAPEPTPEPTPELAAVQPIKAKKKRAIKIVESLEELEQQAN